MLTRQVGDYPLPGHFKLVHHHLHTLQRERSWCTGAHGSSILQEGMKPYFSIKNAPASPDLPVCSTLG